MVMVNAALHPCWMADIVVHERKLGRAQTRHGCSSSVEKGGDNHLSAGHGESHNGGRVYYDQYWPK